MALLIGRPVGQGRAWTKPAELLQEVVGEILTYPTPGDAMDRFSSHGEALSSARSIVLVVDQRGTAEIHWTWISLFAHLGLGPLILLVDTLDAEIEGRARRTGVLRCVEERHLARHPGLLVRAVSGALDRVAVDSRLHLLGAPS
ncbi:MAG: hypothetical protein ACKVXR_00490 [Planctomycetota bacterium]